MKNDGLKVLLYFAYGSLIKGICGDTNDNFVEKAKRYLDGDDSLEGEILEEIYEELPHAIPRLLEMAKKNKSELFSLENVQEYIFKVHSGEVMPSCAVISGSVKGVMSGNKAVVVDGEGKKIIVNYLPSLNKTFKVGDMVYFHHGWVIPKS